MRKVSTTEAASPLQRAKFVEVYGEKPSEEHYVLSHNWMSEDAKDILAYAHRLGVEWIDIVKEILGDIANLPEEFQTMPCFLLEAVLHNAYWLRGTSLDDLKDIERLPAEKVRDMANTLPDGEPIFAVPLNDGFIPLLLWPLQSGVYFIDEQGEYPSLFKMHGFDLKEAPKYVSNDDVERARAMAILAISGGERPFQDHTDDELITLYQAKNDANALRGELFIRSYLPTDGE